MRSNGQSSYLFLSGCRPAWGSRSRCAWSNNPWAQSARCLFALDPYGKGTYRRLLDPGNLAKSKPSSPQSLGLLLQVCSFTKWRTFAGGYCRPIGGGSFHSRPVRYGPLYFYGSARANSHLTPLVLAFDRVPSESGGKYNQRNLYSSLSLSSLATVAHSRSEHFASFKRGAACHVAGLRRSFRTSTPRHQWGWDEPN